MKTAILFYSKHHGNTRKLIDAIKAADDSVTLIDITNSDSPDLSDFDLIGIASGIYAANFSDEIRSYTERYLPNGKKVFFLFTSSMNLPSFTKSIRKITDAKMANVVGQYGCTGYDTFGPFKLIGGVAKGHPDAAELAGAVSFYRDLLTQLS